MHSLIMVRGDGCSKRKSVPMASFIYQKSSLVSVGIILTESTNMLLKFISIGHRRINVKMAVIGSERLSIFRVKCSVIGQ